MDQNLQSNNIAVLDEDLSNEPLVISDDYVNAVVVLAEHLREEQFLLGDLLVEIVDNYEGRKVEVCKYLAGCTGLDWKTLASYESTSRRWSEDKRSEYQHLDYSIYRNTDPEVDKDFLATVIDQNMSTKKALELKYGWDLPVNILRSVLGKLRRMEGEPDPLLVMIEDLMEQYITRNGGTL